MKENKIFCDICGNEINIEVDEDMALFIRSKVEKKVDIQTSFFPDKNMGIKKEILKSSYDLCKKCGSDTEDFLNKKKSEYQVSSVASSPSLFKKVEKLNS